MGNEKLMSKDYNRVSTIVIGAGVAGLAAAITLKKRNPNTDICVVDKSHTPGGHNLSGAAVEAEAIEEFFNMALPEWRDNEAVRDILAQKIDRDLVYNFLNKKLKISMALPIKIANMLNLGPGKMVHTGDYLISISRLTVLMCTIAAEMGIEIMHGFAVKEVIYKDGAALGITIGEQGLDSSGDKQPNYIADEEVYADAIVLAEGCDGLVTEDFVQKTGMTRGAEQLYSLGVKELIRVNDKQYADFGAGTSIHAMGYPIFSIPKGPYVFGGGVMYAMGENHIAIVMITALDWKDCDFNPQDALRHFKDIPFVHQYIEGGTIVEAGAKMIPEGGWLAIARDVQTGSIGKGNVVLVGDCAGFVDMQKIKGIHNAIRSGMLAGEAIADNLDNTDNIAVEYTQRINESCIAKEMKAASNYRQTIAKFGMILGFPLSVIGNLLPNWKIEPDYQTMKQTRYRFKHRKEFDKSTFTAMARTQHREDQPCHLVIQDPTICREKCDEKFASPCIAFCPAGVYESIDGVTRPANPSNCLHCKTCQRKCPYDNIRWTIPEGAGGPEYKNM